MRQSGLRPRDLARAIAAVRDEYLADIWPNGPTSTLYTYGSLSDATWSAWGSIDGLLSRALERPAPAYEPVAAFAASFSTTFSLYVATRRWVRDDATLITDVFTFSTGPNIEALVWSGQTPELIANPYSRHINNLNPSLRGLHHKDALTAANSASLPSELTQRIHDALQEIESRSRRSE